MLSEQQLDSYARFGYVVPDLELHGSIVQKLQEITVRLIAENPSVCAAVRRPHIADSSKSEVVEIRPDWLRIASHPEILDMVQQLIGPDIILWTSTIFYKAPMEVGTPWHRDKCPFLSLENGHAVVTVWIAVFDVLKTDGALVLIPGSRIVNDASATPPTEFGRVKLSPNEERVAVNVELRAGQMVIFDASTIHGSLPNTSFHERYGYSLRYFSGRTRFDINTQAAKARARELILVRGEDSVGSIPQRAVVPEESLISHCTPIAREGRSDNTKALLERVSGV